MGPLLGGHGELPGLIGRLSVVRAIKDVVALVCDHFNVSSNCIHRRTRGNACSEAKSLVAFFAFEPLGMTTKAIANYLGMSHQGACKTVARGRVISWSKGITLGSLSR